MNADETKQDRTIAQLREDITATEDKLKRLERTPAKNSMLASTTAARLAELRRELAALEDAEDRGEAKVGSRAETFVEAIRQLGADSGIANIDMNPDNGSVGQMKSGEPDDPTEALVLAHSFISAPERRSTLGASLTRKALDLTESTHQHTDGWLWADEALTRIEAGDSSRAHWEKLVENLATLLPNEEGNGDE